MNALYVYKGLLWNVSCFVVIAPSLPCLFRLFASNLFCCTNRSFYAVKCAYLLLAQQTVTKLSSQHCFVRKLCLPNKYKRTLYASKLSRSQPRRGKIFTQRVLPQLLLVQQNFYLTKCIHNVCAQEIVLQKPLRDRSFHKLYTKQLKHIHKPDCWQLDLPGSTEHSWQVCCLEACTRSVYFATEHRSIPFQLREYVLNISIS